MWDQMSIRVVRNDCLLIFSNGDTESHIYMQVLQMPGSRFHVSHLDTIEWHVRKMAPLDHLLYW